MAKFQLTGARVPHFRQIIAFGDTIAALAADAGGDTGTVWVFIPETADMGAEGWVRLTRFEIEQVKESK
jgi:hypothetical protein